MLKKTALLVMLLGSSLAPVAWGQDDEDGEDAGMQADAEWAGEVDEAAGNEAGFAEEDVAEASFDDDAAADESDEMADMKDSGRARGRR